MKSLEGQLLIASPKMQDARFSRAVILLLHHDENGAMGIVLNRPMRASRPIRIEPLDDSSKGRFHAGGPVAGPVIVLQGLNTEVGADGPSGRVYVIEKREELEQLLGQDDTDYRFYVGHTGWNGGQLESEIDDGAWLTASVPIDFAFSDEQRMWSNSCVKGRQRCEVENEMRR